MGTKKQNKDLRRMIKMSNEKARISISRKTRSGGIGLSAKVIEFIEDAKHAGTKHKKVVKGLKDIFKEYKKKEIRKMYSIIKDELKDQPVELSYIQEAVGDISVDSEESDNRILKAAPKEKGEKKKKKGSSKKRIKILHTPDDSPSTMTGMDSMRLKSGLFIANARGMFSSMKWRIKHR